MTRASREKYQQRRDPRYSLVYVMEVLYVTCLFRPKRGLLTSKLMVHAEAWAHSHDYPPTPVRGVCGIDSLPLPSQVYIQADATAFRI